MSDDFAELFLSIAPNYVRFLEGERARLGRQIEADDEQAASSEEGAEQRTSRLSRVLGRSNRQVETLFRPYLERQYGSAGAVTFGDKEGVIDAQIAAVKRGEIPIQLNPERVLRIDAEHPVVVSFREGRDVRLSDLPDETIGGNEGEATVYQTERRQQQRRSLLIAGGLLLFFPLMGMVWWVLRPSSPPTVEAEEAISAVVVTNTPYPTHTPYPTPTPLPTVTPFPFAPTIEPIASDERVRPVSLTLPTGRTEQIFVAQQRERWTPQHAVEWWPGTHIRRVIAIADEEGTLLSALFQQMGETIIVRLRSGHDVTYQIADIKPATVYSSEQLYGTTPSLVIVIYPADASDDETRWIVTGRAVQTTQENGQSGSDGNEIGGITVETCQQAEAIVRCAVVVMAGIDRSDLILTDEAWTDAIELVPKTEIERVALVDGTTMERVSVIGTVRHEDARPVLLYGAETIRLAPQRIDETNR